jgi:hypothetical protein
MQHVLWAHVLELMPAVHMQLGDSWCWHWYGHVEFIGLVQISAYAAVPNCIRLQAMMEGHQSEHSTNHV